MTTQHVILHIGLHKTGSTSLQVALGDNRKDFLAQNVDFYRGAYNPDNHIELFLASLREGVETFAADRHKIPARDVLFATTKAQVARYLEQSPAERVIFSAEGLSYLRSVEECARLKALFPETVTDFKVVLVTRDKAAYLKSYKTQILKKAGRAFATDPRSAFYVEDDSWLLDFETLIASYEAVFGPVTTVEFTTQGLLARILETMNVIIAGDLERYRNNASVIHGPFGKMLRALRQKGAVTVDRLGLRPVVRKVLGKR